MAETESTVGSVWSAARATLMVVPAAVTVRVAPRTALVPAA